MSYNDWRAIKDNNMVQEEWAKICEEGFTLVGNSQEFQKKCHEEKATNSNYFVSSNLKDIRANLPKVPFAFAEVQSMGYCFSQELLEMIR